MRTASWQALLILPICASLLACGREPAVSNEALERLSTLEPGNFSETEASVRQYFRGLQSDLERLLEEGAEASRLATAAGRLGMWFQVHLHYQEALTTFELAEELDPTDASWPYYAGYAAHSLGDSATARAAWERSAKLNSSYLPTRIQLAELALEEGDLESAGRHLEAAARLDEDHPRVLLGRAEIELREGRHETAHGLFETVLRERPRSRRTRYGLGMALRGLRRYPEAQRHLSAAARGADQDPTVGLEDPYLATLAASDTSSLKLWRRGRAALQAGQVPQAIEWLEKAVEVAPDRADYRVELGTALARAGRFDDAQAAYLRALRDAPNHDGARIGLAMFYSGSGRPDEAEAEYRKILETRPDHPAANLRLAHLLRSRGDLVDAGTYYERAVKVDPRDESPRFWRAWTTHLQGRSAAATRLLEGDLELLGDKAMLLTLKARLGTRPGASAAETLAAHELASRLFDRSANAFYAETLAMTLAARGQFEDAVLRQQAVLDAARAAGLADTGAMEQRLESYRAKRRTEILLSDSDTAAVDLEL